MCLFLFQGSPFHAKTKARTIRKVFLRGITKTEEQARFCVYIYIYLVICIYYICIIYVLEGMIGFQSIHNR